MKTRKKALLKILMHVSVMLVVIITALWLLMSRPFSSSSPGQVHDIDPVQLKEQVRVISEDYYPRNVQYPENLAALADYLFAQFKQYTNAVEFEEYEVDGQLYRNVIARYGPQAGKVVVIGAHYDTYLNLPGADDNASGVAGLLELGRLLQNTELSVGVQLVAYCLEEPPYYASEKMGSFFHAANLKAANVDVQLMISLEMIGYFSDEAGSQSYPMPLLNLYYPRKGDFIAVIDQLASNQALRVKSAINQYTNIAAYSINAPAFVPGVDYSDHRNYWAHGYPAVMVTDTAFYRNQNYHTKTDTFDGLNYEKMAEVINGVFALIKNIEPTD